MDGHAVSGNRCSPVLSIVTWDPQCLKSSVSRLFVKKLVHANFKGKCQHYGKSNIKENTKGQHHQWPMVSPHKGPVKTFSRADSRLAPSQWETSLQCNTASHWLGANLESALVPMPWHENTAVCLLLLCITGIELNETSTAQSRVFWFGLFVYLFVFVCCCFCCHVLVSFNGASCRHWNWPSLISVVYTWTNGAWNVAMLFWGQLLVSQQRIFNNVS